MGNFFKSTDLKKLSSLIYIISIVLFTSFAFHLYFQNFIFFSKNTNPNLDKAYKEIHHPQTEKTQKQALDFIAEVASQPKDYTEDESFKALNLLSGVVFHFGIKSEGMDALKKIYENIFITKNQKIRIRSILYLEWISLQWTPQKKSYKKKASLSLDLNYDLNSEEEEIKTNNLALRATEYLLSLIFLNKPFIISNKERAIVLRSLYTISKQSENPEARVFSMNQLFNIAFLRSRGSF